MLNNRAIEIIKDLIDHEEITVKELAKKFKTSTRTIYYDLENINYFLNHNGFQGSLRNGKNFFLNIEEKEKIKILVGNGDVISPEERKEYLIIKIFFYGLIKLSNEMKKLEVTRKTIENDIKEIKKEFAEYNLELISLPGKGITIKGREGWTRGLFIRYLIKLFIQKHNLKPLILNVLNEIYVFSQGEKLEGLIRHILKKRKFKASLFEYYGFVSTMITEVIMENNKLILEDEKGFIYNLKFDEKDKKELKEDIVSFGFNPKISTIHLMLFIIKRQDEDLCENYKDDIFIHMNNKTIEFIKEFQEYYPHKFWNKKIRSALTRRFEVAKYKYLFNCHETLGIQNNFPERQKSLYKRIKSISEKYFGELLEEDLERITYVIGDFINQYEEKTKPPKKVIIIHYNLGIALKRDIAKHLSSLWHLKVIRIIPGYYLEDFLEENKETIDGIIIFENGYLRSIKTDIPVIPLNIFELEETSGILADYGFNKKVKY